MTRTTFDPSAEASEPEPDGAPLGNANVWRLVLRFALGLAIVVAMVSALSHWLRADAEAVARRFVDSYGYWGMALGTLLADGFHFPVPPQAYMLLAIASRASTLWALLAIGAASLLAGGVGYGLARWVGRARWVAASTQRTRWLLDRAYRRFGVKSALWASLLPVPYSVLCYLAGLNRMPAAFLALLGLCRIPKLGLFYALVYWGWRSWS